MPNAAIELQRERLSVLEACWVVGIDRIPLYDAILKDRKHGKLIVGGDLLEFLKSLVAATE